MKIILASGSPRRQDLMKQAKIPYEVMVSEFDEKVDNALSLEEQSKEIAYGKAKSREEAIEMLKTIQGKSHKIYTSIAVLIEKNGQVKCYKELSQNTVFVKNMTDLEMEHYVDTEKPYFCAGAYAIQGVFTVFIEKIEGDYPAVLGLPIHRIYDILKENNCI